MEIYRYEPQSIDLTIKIGSEYQDADELPTARLISNEPDPYSIDRMMIVTHSSVGVYNAQLNMLDVAEERKIIVEWTYVIDGVTINKTEHHFVITPYNTIDELKYVSPDNISDLDIRAAAEFARNIIDNACGQSFGRKYLTVDVAGSNKPIITLNQNILHIQSISINDEILYQSGESDNLISVSITPTGRGIKIDSTTQPIFEDDGFIVRTEGTFQPDYRYTIKGLFGWDYVPSAIREAHKLLVNDWFCKDAKWRKNYIEQMKSADWNVKFDSRVYGETGNFYVDNLLSDYKHLAMVVP